MSSGVTWPKNVPNGLSLLRWLKGDRTVFDGANENIPGPDCVLGRSLNSPPPKSAHKYSRVRAVG